MSFLYDQSGKRKYLTIDERRAFLEVAVSSQPEIHTFCATLAYTGARISEVLALTPYRIDYSGSLIVIESLKKRKAGIFREVPVPVFILEKINATHDIRTRQRATSRVPGTRHLMSSGMSSGDTTLNCLSHSPVLGFLMVRFAPVICALAPLR